MSKRGKQKKAENVERRKLQMAEALECQAIKQAAEMHLASVVRRQPKRCTFRYCQRYVDPSCTVCPYCGSRLEPAEGKSPPSLFTRPAMQGC